MFNTVYIKLLFALVIVSYKSNAEIPHPLHGTENKGRCSVPELPTKFLPIGKSVTIPGRCYLVTCNLDLTISGLTCPTYIKLPGCWTSNINYYKDFPDCCPQFLCNAF